jgi:hypothetical protein
MLTAEREKKRYFYDKRTTSNGTNNKIDLLSTTNQNPIHKTAD